MHRFHNKVVHADARKLLAALPTESIDAVITDAMYGPAKRYRYSDREYEAAMENIPLAAWRLKNDYDLPEGWEGEVYSWLSDHRCSALDNSDDQGGYPGEDDLEAAFDALGYQRTE